MGEIFILLTGDEMNKQEVLEKVYNSALEDELSKIAVSPSVLRQYENPERVRMLVNALKESIGHPKKYVSIATKDRIKHNVKKKAKS